MNHLDGKISVVIADVTRRSRVLTFVASVAASHLLWLMIGIAIGRLSVHLCDDPWPCSNQVTLLDLPVLLIVAWLVAFGLELVFRRKRPFQQARRQPLIHMLLVPPSFPSAHATLAFATAVWMRTVDPVTWPVFLLLAVSVAIARVAVGVHYLSDVIAGAVVGTLVPWGLTYLAFYVFM